MPFVPGVSGNPSGTAKEKIVTDALRLAANDVFQSGKFKGQRKLRVAAQKVVDKAAEGDIQAFQIIADRLDGKPQQAIEGKVELGASQLFLEILRAMNPQANEPKVIEHEPVE